MDLQKVIPHELSVHSEYHALKTRPDGRSFAQYREYTAVSRQEYLFAEETVRLGHTMIHVALRTEILVSESGLPTSVVSIDLASPFGKNIQSYCVLKRFLLQFLECVIDTNKLCIVKDLAYWALGFHITVINDDGNSCDAGLLGLSKILAAFRFPSLSFNEEEQSLTTVHLVSDDRIPLRYSSLRSCTVKILPSQLLIDPTCLESNLPGALLHCILTASKDILLMNSSCGSSIDLDQIVESTHSYGMCLL